MLLKKIKFCRFKGGKYEWSIEGKPINGREGQPVTFQNINLVVGKNASGKSNTILAIRQLSDLLSGEVRVSQVYETASYDLIFDNQGNEVAYSLAFEKGLVQREYLKINGIDRLFREGKSGRMFYAKVNDFLEFEMEDDRLAVSRMDHIQQPFFEPLQHWGKTLNHYRFGGQLGKKSLLRDLHAVPHEEEFGLKDSNEVAKIFVRGDKAFGEEFRKSIIDDMHRISYPIDQVAVDAVRYMPIGAFGLGVKERDMADVTDQLIMSQGMFRALSLIVQLNYSLMSKMPSCILIDDIGEGLDYERSKSLIDLIIEKIEPSTVQVIMTTNDRFVMNNIPLEYWSVIHRMPGKAVFYNYQNSKEIFDDFKYTGLSNFDFLSTAFYFDGFEQEGGQ